MPTWMLSKSRRMASRATTMQCTPIRFGASWKDKKRSSRHCNSQTFFTTTEPIKIYYAALYQTSLLHNDVIETGYLLSFPPQAPAQRMSQLTSLQLTVFEKDLFCYSLTLACTSSRLSNDVAACCIALQTATHEQRFCKKVLLVAKHLRRQEGGSNHLEEDSRLLLLYLKCTRFCSRREKRKHIY